MKLHFLLPLLLSLPLNALGQYALHPCASNKLTATHPTAALRGTVADQREEDYDVRYVKLDIQLNNVNTAISGNVLTRATTRSTISSYVFELTNDLVIDSVKAGGQLRTFTHTGEVGAILLGTSVPANTLLETQIYYHGAVPSGSAFFDRGLRNVFSGAALRRYTFTLGEPYAVKDWWPCKQALQDKIDSSDVWITVPDTLMAGSNGILQRVTPVSSGRKRFEWKSSNPIDYYLISACVGNYSDYSYFMHFSNSSDSMLIQNYMYPNALPLRKPVLDSTALMVDYFSTLFGRYPFWKEKYGHCQAPLSGGEEHQTMTTIGIWESEVVPHELAHQWFGDHVTCGTWKDIWLNEGLATYAEYLHVAHFESSTRAAQKIASIHRNSMVEAGSTNIDPTGAVYVDDTTDEQRIFSSRLSYNKGGSVAHTLRFEANNDTLFFNMLQAYQAQFANSTATTEEFKNLVAQQYGRNMDTFFNQWIYSSGWPVFNATWNQVNNSVIISLDQQTTGNFTAHRYSTPLEIRLNGPQGDTIVRVFTNDGATVFTIPWARPVTGITIDPNDWLLDAAGTITQNSSLYIAAQPNRTAIIYPNPVHDFLNISGLPAGELYIMDVTGKLLLKQPVTGAATTRADLRGFLPGLYIYRLQQKGKASDINGRFVKD